MRNEREVSLARVARVVSRVVGEGAAAVSAGQSGVVTGGTGGTGDSDSLHTRTHAHTHTQGLQPRWRFTRDAVPPVTPSYRLLGGGRAETSDGGLHRMHLASPSRSAARHYNLNRNHHVRVWCSCQNQPGMPPGTFSERSTAEVLADPRRLGGWDAIGYVDVRVPGSALDMWKQHLAEVESQR